MPDHLGQIQSATLTPAIAEPTSFARVDQLIRNMPGHMSEGVQGSLTPAAAGCTPLQELFNCSNDSMPLYNMSRHMQKL